VVPSANAVGISLEHYSLETGRSENVGLSNYAYLLGSPEFHHIFWITIAFNLVVNPLMLIVSMALALLLQRNDRLAGLWRSLAFAPAALPGIVVALMWSVILQPDGPLNAVLRALGLPAQPFLTSASQALPSIGLMVIWGGAGYWMIFLNSGLSQIPGEVYEAAMLDGARWFRRLMSITLPLMRRQMAFVLAASSVGTFLVFAPVQAITQGGPENSTDLLMYDVYNNAYQIGDTGVAMAEVVLLMLVLGAILAVQFAILREKKE
jgi:multiple sugar transport system permease protein